MGRFFYTQNVPTDVLINVFFLYSFLGWCMECVVIRREKGAWENRGFAHSPFCVIYGFGAMLGYAALRPLMGHEVLLYITGAIAATAFEFLTGCLMQRLFGEFWWDYSGKRFNYRGMICLESTVAWGAITLFVFHFLHRSIFSLVLRLPRFTSVVIAWTLVTVYLVDFSISLRRARRTYRERDEHREELTERGELL